MVVKDHDTQLRATEDLMNSVGIPYCAPWGDFIKAC